MHPSYSELRWNCQHSRKLACEYWNPFLWQNAFPQLTSANNHQRALKPVLEQMQCCSWRDVAKQAAEKLHGDSMIKGNLPHLTIKSMSTQQTSLLGSWVRLAFSILSWPRTNLHTHSVSKHFSTGVLGCPPSVLGAPLGAFVTFSRCLWLACAYKVRFTALRAQSRPRRVHGCLSRSVCLGWSASVCPSRSGRTHGRTHDDVNNAVSPGLRIRHRGCLPPKPYKQSYVRYQFLSMFKKPSKTYNFPK